MARDPYDILGVPRDADDEDIRRAYRRLAKKEHPDADGGDDNYFWRLNDAYESIRTRERRRAHSREGARVTPPGWSSSGREGSAWRTPPAGDMRSAWRARSGGGFRPGPERSAGPGNGGRWSRGRHYRLEVRLTPEETRRGVSLDVDLPDGRHRIDVPAGVEHGDVLSFSESSPGGERISLDLEVVVR